MGDSTLKTIKMKDTALKIVRIMNKQSLSKTLLPQCDGRALDVIKVCAAIFMVIDHINLLWFDRSSFILSLLGRASFPLFAYAVAAGAQRGSKHYVAKLLLLAVISQPVFMWVTGERELNVVFTLAAGALMTRLPPAGVIVLALLSIPATLLPEINSFGLAGIMLPALIMQRSLLILPALFCLSAQGFENSAAYWIVEAQLGLASSLLPLMTIRAATAFSGRQRVLPRYALHIFYPAHLVVLKLIQGVFT